MTTAPDRGELQVVRLPVARLRGVRVVRGERTLLDDIDLEVGAADRWVVLGPNGAGKTTLLQLLAARMHPSAGTVELLGDELGAVDVFELRPRIGLSSTALDDSLPPSERVRDVVVTAAYGVVGRFREAYDDVDLRRADDLLIALGADGLADRAYGTLSEGERKRVQIARALMTDPELMLLDEPAAGLDLAGREDLVTRLAVLAEDEASPALVVVTHHVEEIPPAFTHVLLLRAGRVVAAGPIEETLTPASLSETFGLPLALVHVRGRYAARLRPPRRARRPR